VADAVARAGEDHAVARRDGAQVAVVVCVLEADLHGVVVDVRDRQVGLDLFEAHRLELQVGHRAGGVLREGLVDTDADLAAFHVLAFFEVGNEDLFDDVLFHEALLGRTLNLPPDGGLNAV